MFVNFRYNSKVSKQLSKMHRTSKKKGITATQLYWHSENSKKIIGNIYRGLFNRASFLITYYDDQARLFHVNKNGLSSVYLIEDIEGFLDYCPMQFLEIEDDNLYHLLRQSSIIPLSGVVRYGENGIQVYNHKNY